jgi:tetratricopeptide (TPR) repeat protein
MQNMHRRTRTDVTAPKLPATTTIMATLVTGQPESPTVVDRALVSLTDAHKARADRLSRELEMTAGNDPAHAASIAYELGALCERELDDEERALTAYRRALELDPSNIPNRWALRGVLYRRGLWPELERMIDIELKRAGEDAERVDLLFERALVSGRRKGGDDQARTALVGASQLAPHHQGVLFELERLISRSRDKQRLVDVWERLAEAIDQPERKVSHLLEVARACAATDYKRATRAFDMATQLAMAVSTAVGVRVTREALRYADMYGTPADIAGALDGFAQTLGAAVSDAGSGERRSAAYARLQDFAALRRRQAQLVRSEKPVEAWGLLQDALSMCPDDPVLLGDLIELAAELGRYKELLVLVNAWRNGETDTGRGRMLSAWCAEARLSDERRQQSRVLRGALNVTAPGFILLTSAAECDALVDTGQQRAELATAYLEAARAAADGTWMGPGTSPQPDPSAAASLYVQAAEVFAHYVGTAEATVQAQEALESALELVPDHPAALEAAIELDDLTGQPKRALERCNEIAKASPGDRTILERALRVAITHNVTDAILDLQRRIVALDPADCWAAWRLDATLAQHGRLDDERKAVLSALAAHETDPARRCTALVGAARYHERAGDAEAALALYRELLAMCPTDAFVRDAYSELLRTHERWDELASERLDSVRGAAGANADAQFVRRALREAAWVLEVRLGDLARAADAYEEWLSRLPADRTALEGAARCRAALRDPDREVGPRAPIAEIDGTPEARVLYARSLERAGRAAEAMTEYRTLLAHDDGSVAVLTGALALGELAGNGANIALRIEGAEAVAKRTADTQLGSALHEHSGWLHLMGQSALEPAAHSFAAALAVANERRGALLGALLAAGRRGDRAGQGSSIAALAPSMPTPASQASLLLRAAAVAAANGNNALATERVDAALHAAPDDLDVMFVVTESNQPARNDRADPFTAVDDVLTRAELLARRSALTDDGATRTAWELERADSLEAGGQDREATAVLAAVLESEPTNRRALAAVRRIARRANDLQTLAQASYTLAGVCRERTVQLRLLRDAAAFYDRPGASIHAAYARTIYARIVEIDPEATEVDRLLDLQREGGDVAPLVNSLTEQIVRLAEAVPPEEHRIVPLILERSTLLRSLGQTDAARADLDALLVHAPMHVEALRLRADLAAIAGDKAGAIAMWQKFLSVETTGARRIEVEKLLEKALDDDDDLAPPPPPLRPKAVTGSESTTDVRAFEDEHGAWEMEFTDPDAPQSPTLDVDTPIPKKTNRRISNVIRRVTPTQSAALEPTLETDVDAFEANTVVGEAIDPFGGQTATADLSSLQEEERRLAEAAARLEESSVVAAAESPAPRRRATMFTAPRASPSEQLGIVEARRTSQQQAVVEEPAPRPRSSTAGPTFIEGMHRASAHPRSDTGFEQKSMVTVADKPSRLDELVDERTRAAPQTLFAPPLNRVETAAPLEPLLDVRQLTFPQTDVDIEGSAAVLMSYDQLMPAAKTEAAEDMLHEHERELALVADEPEAALALHLEAGRLAEVAGELDRARGHYDAALALDPGTRQAMRGLRRLARERGDLADALRLLDAELAIAAPRERDAALRYRLHLLLGLEEHTLAHAAVDDLLARDPADVAAQLTALELAIADDRIDDMAAHTERLADLVTGELRGALHAARAVLAARQADHAAAGLWFRRAAEADPESPALRLEVVRDAAASGQQAPDAALLDLAYRVEREDPIAAAAIAVRSQSWNGADTARETFAAAAQLAAGAAPRDPLVGRIAAETALLTEEPAQASHAFARWVRCKSVPVERAFAAARAAELDPARLGRLWSQVLDLDPGDDYATARVRAVHVAAGAKDQVIELDLETAKTSQRDVPLLRATAELVRERRIDEAIDVLTRTREYRPTWVLAEALADAYTAAKKWIDRAAVLGELVAEPGLLAPDIVRLRSAFASDRAARGSSTSSETRERQSLAALDAWNLVLGDDPRSLVAHAAAVSIAGRFEDRAILVKVLARARGAERSPWGASSLSLRYGRMLLASNSRLAQTVARDAAPALDDPRTTVARVMAASQRRELGEAISALEERATQRETQPGGSPSHEPAMLCIRAACLALDAGELPRAKQLLARVDKALPGLVDDLLEVARHRANDPAPTALRARATADGFARLLRDADLAASRSDHALALQLYQRASALRPDDPFGVMPLVRTAFKLRAAAPLTALVREQLRSARERGDALASADAYELTARVDEMRGDVPAAIASLEEAVKLDPSRRDVAHQIACEVAAAGQYGKLLTLRLAEIDVFASSEVTERDRVALLFDAATLAMQDKRPDDVVAKLCHRVLELDRRNRLSLFHLEAIVRKANAFEQLAVLEEHIAGVFDEPSVRATFLTRAGEVLADTGKRAEAVQRFARAVELVPSYLPALEAWHDTALAGGLWTELAEAVTRKSTLGGTTEEIAALHHFAGVALMDMARARDAATVSLRRSLDVMPGNLDALLRLRILLEHGAHREEYASYVRRRLETEPDRKAQVELHRMLAEHCRGAGQRDEALRHYRAMLAIAPADVRAHAAIADISIGENDWAAVADAVNARIPLERDVHVLATLHQRLGVLYAESDVAEAVRQFQRALTYRPDDEETLVRLTDLAIAAGMWDIAVGACDRLVTTERDPERLAAHLHRAAMIFFRGFSDRERADRMVRLAVDSAPASPDSLRALVQFYQEAGDAQALAGQLDRIIETMRARIDADAQDGMAYCTLSRALVARGSQARLVIRAAAEMAQALGTAGESEHRLLADDVPGDLSRLAAPVTDDELFAGAAVPALRDLVRRFAEPLAKHVGVDLAVHGVGRKERLRPPHQMTTIARAVATSLGFKDVEVYVSTRHPFTMAAEPTNPVSLIVGEAIVGGSAPVMRFAAGAALKLAQLSLSIPARLSPADLGALALALLRLANPDGTGPQADEIVQAHMQRLRKLVPAAALADARPLAIAASSGNVQALARDLKIAGLRAGLAASGSLVGSLSAVAGAVGTGIQNILSDPIGRGLISFALSEHRNPQ